MNLQNKEGDFMSTVGEKIKKRRKELNLSIAMRITILKICL